MPPCRCLLSLRRWLLLEAARQLGLTPLPPVSRTSVRPCFTRLLSWVHPHALLEWWTVRHAAVPPVLEPSVVQYPTSRPHPVGGQLGVLRPAHLRRMHVAADGAALLWRCSLLHWGCLGRCRWRGSGDLRCGVHIGTPWCHRLVLLERLACRLGMPGVIGMLACPLTYPHLLRRRQLVGLLQLLHLRPNLVGSAGQLLQAPLRRRLGGAVHPLGRMAQRMLRSIEGVGEGRPHHVKAPHCQHHSFLHRHLGAVPGPDEGRHHGVRVLIHTPSRRVDVGETLERLLSVMDGVEEDALQRPVEVVHQVAALHAQADSTGGVHCHRSQQCSPLLLKHGHGLSGRRDAHGHLLNEELWLRVHHGLAVHDVPLCSSAPSLHLAVALATEPISVSHVLPAHPVGITACG